MKIVIHYFSATGNTARGVSIIQKTCEDQGNEVDIKEITERVRPDETDVDMSIFAFPTLAWAAPSFVLSYIRKMPKVQGAKAAVFATYGGHPGGALAHVAGILKRRGYKVILTGGALYPDNWTQMINPPAPEEAEKMIVQGDNDAVEFAQNLLRGKAKRFRCSAVIFAIGYIISLLFRSIGRRFLGKTYIVDEACNGCELCVKTCPTGTIEMAGRGRKRPRWGSACAACGRCINICPQTAIQTSLARLIIYSLLSVVVAFLSVVAFARLQFIFGDISPLIRWLLSLVIVVALTGVLLVISFGIFDRTIYTLESISGLQRIFCYAHTRKFRRYRAPRFKP